MPLPKAVAQFDEISPVYDATRDPLDDASVRRIADTLRSWEMRRLVEVGVGTGRIATPLLKEGFQVTGVDASRGMLARARAKGLSRLVRGSAYRLPFSDMAVDGALFVHVLHVLEDPFAALGEACRVAGRGAAALVAPPGSPERRSADPLDARRRVVAHLRAEGAAVPGVGPVGGGPQTRERRLLEAAPPDRLVIISEADVTEGIDEQLRMFEARASRWALEVPPEQLARAVAEVRRELGDARRTYHRVRALALWTSPPRVAPEVLEGPPSSASIGSAPLE